MEALQAAAEDWKARVEREALRQIAAYARRGWVGELHLTVNTDGEVEVSEAVTPWRRDARWSVVELTRLNAVHYVERAAELGL